jgi:type IV secretion system protein VirD4
MHSLRSVVGRICLSICLLSGLAFIVQGCKKEPDKQQLAPIIDGSVQGHGQPYRPNQRIQTPPPSTKTHSWFGGDEDDQLLRQNRREQRTNWLKWFGFERSSWDGSYHFAPERMDGLLGTISIPLAVICLLLGALVGTYWSDRFHKVRKFVGWAIIVLFLLKAAPVAYVGWFFLGAIICFKLLRIAGQSIFGKGKKVTTFGSAEWADLEHLQQQKIIGTAGYTLGYFVNEDKKHYPLHYDGPRHLLTVAPTRAGKGVSAITPNLLTCGGSALVIDPKGENARQTRRARLAMGQDVHVVDPWGITGLPVSTFNPVEWLDPGDMDIGENALMLADAIIVRSGKGENAFWDDEAVALLWGLILHVALDANAGADRSLPRVRDLINLPETQFDELLQDMYQSSGHLASNIISGAAARTLGKEPKLRSNVLATLQSHTHFLDSPRIRQSLRGSDSTFKFEDLKISKMTVYLVLPADRLSTFGRWLRLLIQQAITVNARNIEVKPKQPILFMLDEMAALGRLQKVEEAYGLMAGFGMQLWGIIQDFSQLERIYDKGWETFVGNSGVLQYFGSRDVKTAEYFSKLCGVATVEKFSVSRSLARAVSSSFSTGQGVNSNSTTSTTSTHSVSADHIQRHLAFPDELMVLRDNKSLLFVENSNPIDARKIIWYQDHHLKQLGDSIQ